MQPRQIGITLGRGAAGLRSSPSASARRPAAASQGGSTAEGRAGPTPVELDVRAVTVTGAASAAAGAEVDAAEAKKKQAERTAAHGQLRTGAQHAAERHEPHGADGMTPTNGPGRATQATDADHDPGHRRRGGGVAAERRGEGCPRRRGGGPAPR